MIRCMIPVLYTVRWVIQKVELTIKVNYVLVTTGYHATGIHRIFFVWMLEHFSSGSKNGK